MKIRPKYFLCTAYVSVLFYITGLPGQVAEEPSLFYGTDLAIRKGDQILPVLDYENERFVVVQDGKKKHFQLNSKITVQGALKFSTQYITLSESSEKRYSAYLDRLTEEYNQLMSLQMSSGASLNDPNSPDINYDDRLMELDMEIADARENPDSIRGEITFSPHWNHEKVFLLGVAHFTIDKAGKISKGVKIGMLELPDLKAGATQTATVDMRNLPEGFQLDHVTYHFYSKGLEIPTNESTKRRILNEEQTYEYMFLQYLSLNEGKTRGPSLYQPVSRDEFEAYLKADEMKNVVLTLLIDAKGKTAQVEVKSGLTAFQKEICELARQAQFFPTLKNGEPVEQKINVRLSQIAL